MAVVEVVGVRGSKLHVNEQALQDILCNEEIAGLPAAVICVAGIFRSGKSFLLNFFLKYLACEEAEAAEWLRELPEDGTGFKWKPGSVRVTTGVGMWSKPFMRNINGKKTALLLFDTQGTFDNETTMAENVRIFSMASIFSSLLINNIQGKISEDNLQNLQLFVGFGHMVKEREGQKGALQATCFLVRDWENTSTFKHGLEEGGRYLATVLTHEGRSPELTQLRSNIRESFSSIDCFLMPRPGDDFIDACEFGKPDMSKLRPAFVENLRQFVPWAVNAVQPKTVAGTTVSCRDLSLLIVQCATVFNQDDMPKVDGLFDAVSRVNHLTVRLGAVEKYVASMQPVETSKKYMSPTDVATAHTVSRELAMQYFDSTHKLGSQAFAEPFRKELDTDIEDRYRMLQELNAARRSSSLFTVVALCAIAIVSNVISTVFYYLGLSPLVSLLSSITWLSVVAALVWFYCHTTGEFPEVRDHLDAAVDSLRPFVATAATKAAPLVSSASGLVGGDKKSQ